MNSTENKFKILPKATRIFWIKLGETTICKGEPCF